MKSALLLSCLALFGCAANIYRVKSQSSMCESLIATECSDKPADPNRVRLCGSLFANRADFLEEAYSYCKTPTLRNCALQCCDVQCGPAMQLVPAPAATAPAAPPAAVQPAPVVQPAPTVAPPAPSVPPPAPAPEPAVPPVQPAP